MIRLPGQLQIAYQEAGGGGVAALGQRANGIVRGSENLDLPLQQFLLNAQTDLGEHVVQKLMSYAAQLQVLGVLAGVLDGPTEQYRNAIKAAAGSYFEDVVTRSQRTSYWENTSPLDGAATAVGYLYKASGLVAGAVGSETWAKKYDDIGNTLITTDPDKLIGNIGLDIMKAIWDSCKQRWDQFWVDFKEKGLLVAYGKLQIDGAFLAAELAIDIALGAITGGVGAFVGRGLKIIGTRISSIASRVIVRATGTVAKGVPESGILLDVAVPDSQINQRILREILDEDKLGVGSHSDDVAKRAEVPDPKKEEPAGGGGAAAKSGKLQRGRNENEISYDSVTGRPNGAKGTLREDFGGTTRGDNATAIGRLGNTGDQGGHLVAHRFMGDTPDYGIAPQAGNLNQGAWKTMENEWADWIKKGYEVDYQVDVYPPGSVRPDLFRSTYSVKDPKTGEIKYQNRKNFRNRAGETFERVPFRDME
jgi:hypothetical protein